VSSPEGASDWWSERAAQVLALLNEQGHNEGWIPRDLEFVWGAPLRETGFPPVAPLLRFVCHICGMSSTEPHDIRERYCGHCHAFTGVAEDPTRRRDGYSAEVQCQEPES
jgi:hypothetical protein